MEIKYIIAGGAMIWSSLAGAQTQIPAIPVLSIPDKIVEMREMSGSDRAQIVKNFRLQYRANIDVNIWENLKDFSVASEALFVDMKDEDWVIREAVYLQNVSRVGLIKYAPINKENLIENFAGLRDEGSSFEVLNYWFVGITHVTSAQEVLDLASFGEYARDWAIRTQQEAYIVREADKLILAGSERVSRLRPAHEGLYKIKTYCTPRPTDCKPDSSQLSHLSVFDTLSARGLIVSLSNSKYSTAMYLYTTAELTKRGTHVRGLSTEATPYTRVSEVTLDIDPTTGELHGILKDEAYPGVLHIVGTPIKRIMQFYNDGAPSRVISTENILGRYKGLFAGVPAELVVSRYTDGTIVGVVTYTNSRLVIPYRSGDYNSEHGVLVLTGMGSGIDVSDRKLVLGLRKDKNGREVLKGFMLLFNQKLPETQLYRVSDK